MSKILIIENDHAFVRALKEFLSKEFHETDEVIAFHEFEEFEEAANTRKFFDDISLALTDLELGPGRTDLPTDFEGRDRVLPKLRSVAPWIPTILVSRYVIGNMAAVTPFGFDAALSKDWFGPEPNYRNEWGKLRYYATLNRNAALTGRAVKELEILLARPLVLEYGAGLNPIINKVGHDHLQQTLQLMDLGGEKVVFDELVMGYSGLNVVKATVESKTRRTCWLLKFGSPTRKLNEELQAHRRMFVNGLTRRFSVPPFWWFPIFWKNIGVIAYEFEPESESFLSLIKRMGYKKAFEDMRPAFTELYRGSTSTQIVPRKVLSKQFDALEQLPSGQSYGLIVDAIRTKQANSALDTSLHVISGCQHGDLHTRNILISAKGTTFIDFAHYRSAEDGGIPLLDLVKLLVDCWVLDAATDPDRWSASDIVSGRILNSNSVRSLTELFSDSHKDEFSEDEVRFFTLAARCCLALDTSYPEVDRVKREEALNAIRS